MFYGGEGGIRTPDRLTPMSDFESGAFNRALPPLRIVSRYLSVLTPTFRTLRFAPEATGGSFGSRSIIRIDY